MGPFAISAICAFVGLAIGAAIAVIKDEPVFFVVSLIPFILVLMFGLVLEGNEQEINKPQCCVICETEETTNVD